MDLREATYLENTSPETSSQKNLNQRAPGSKARHPWETTRFDFFQKTLRDFKSLDSQPRILDVGSGDAWFSGQLASKNQLPQICCWDLNYSAQSQAKLGIDTQKIRLCSEQPTEQFDLILLLDVLEHIEDSHAFLQHVVDQNLAPGGQLLISVPAWQPLFSSHDHWLLHFRRYMPAEFSDTLERANLQPQSQGGLFHSLLLPRSITVLRERFLGDAQQAKEPSLGWHGGPLLTRLVTRALKADNWLSHQAANLGIPLPGLSLWALCKLSS